MTPSAEDVTFRDGRFSFAGSSTWCRVVEPTEPSDLPPLVLLHGGPGSTSCYLEPLTRLAASGRAVVLYDQIGCGRSAVRGAQPEWTIELFAAELAQLRAHLGLAEIHLWGCSWGGMLALEHVLRGATGVQSLMLSSTPVDMRQWEAEILGLVLAMPPSSRRSLLAGPSDPGFEAALRAFYARHGYRGTRLPRCIGAGLRGRNEDVYVSMVGESEWAVSGSLRGWSVVDRLHELTMPVQLLYGRYDLCTRAVIELTADRVPEVEIVRFARSGHTPFIQEATAYRVAIAQFTEAADAARLRLKQEEGLAPRSARKSTDSPPPPRSPACGRPRRTAPGSRSRSRPGPAASSGAITGSQHQAPPNAP